MPYETWPSIVVPPQDGEPVNNLTTSRAHKSLAERTEFLKSRLEDYSTKNGRILLSEVLLGEGVGAGDVVYYNMGTESYDKAIAEGWINPENGVFEATRRAFAIGICVNVRNNGNYGDVLVYGLSNLLEDFAISPSDLFDQSSNYKPNGTRGYLSSLIPGKLTSRPGSPLIQVGVFGSPKSYINLLQKDIFESHLHYRFSLPTKPAASQNADKKGARVVNENIYIDYFSSTITDRQYPLVSMSIRKSSSPSPYGTFNPARIEIRRGTSDRMRVTVVSGVGINPDNISSAGTTSVAFSMDWPDYGEEVEIVNGSQSTGLIVSFFRLDNEYLQTLEEDVADGSLLTGDVFKVFLPNDLSGWTNANTANINTPIGARYRLVHESIEDLDSVWPPTPVDSAIIETGGIARIRNLEFIPSNHGIFWMSGVPPWIQDLPLSSVNQSVIASGGTPSAASTYVTSQRLAEKPSTLLYFSKSSMENSRGVVLSLGSNSPAITVTDCFTGTPAQSGHLKLGLDLSLNEEDRIQSEYVSYSGIDPGSNKFKKTSVVSNIVPGIGISVVKNQPTPGTSANCGSVTIGVKNLKFEGAIEVVSLINAKEDLVNDLVPVIWFLPSSTGTYKMVSRVRIPKEDLPTGSISLMIQPSIVGSESTSSNKTGVFNTKSYVIRGGSSLMDPGMVTENNLNYSFLNYTGYNIGTIDQSFSMSGNILPGDQVYTVWERISDTYTGKIGFTQIYWKIETQ
jgi:hypothetical protein